MKRKPKVSIAIPVWDGMPNGEFFLKRCLDSIARQTFTDYEIVITRDGGMAENINSAIRKSKGTIIKILFQDDYFYHDDSLKEIVKAWKGRWLVTGCIHDSQGQVSNPHYASFKANDIVQGINTIGSPSVMAISNVHALYFDESLTWVLDCDYYIRLFEQYGEPTILNDINVAIGIGSHQTTNTLSATLKHREQNNLFIKYAKT